MSLPTVKMNEGIHVMHLFYKLDRIAWDELSPEESAATRGKLEALCAANSNASHPQIRSYANVGGKADLVFWLFHGDLAGLAQLHRDLEGCFPPGTIDTVYSYLSVTELTEYQPTEDDLKARAQREFKLEEGTPEFEAKLVELVKRKADYEKFRIYPEMPDWEIMCFYPMLKKRQGEDNWYMLDFDTRKKLMRTHAVTGRKFAGRIKQLITGSSGLDDWEWGVTLMAQQLDAVKEIVYEMRLDEVSAKYAEFGPFYINLRLEPEALWKHLGL
jgi:chlorite dismutase